MWEPAAAAGGDLGVGPRCVRVRTSTDAQVFLELVQSCPGTPDAEYAIRVARAGQQQDRMTTQRQLEILQAAVDDAGEAVVVVDVEELRYEYVNNTAARLFHLSREELMRLGPRESLVWPAGPTGPTENATRLRQTAQRVFDRHPEATTEESEVTRLDGTLFRAEFTRRAVSAGGHWLMVSLIRDVTERRATQARLELFKRALDDADEAIYLVDPRRLAFVDVNERACRNTHFSREELMRRGPVGWDFSAEELRARYAEAIAAYPGSIKEDVQRTREGGAPYILESVRRAIRSEGEWLIIIHIRDITERVVAEREVQRKIAELARSNEDLEQFGYVTSHDLSEPLRMMASYSQLLNRRYGDRLDNDAREFMGFILEGSKRMKLLIDALLAYSRAGRGPARKGPIALDRALDDALANLAHAVRDAGASIEREPLPNLEAEPVAMMQLFQNLVGNALKFRGPDAPVIRIQAADMGEEWHISVSDNGIGIAPEHFKRIFIVFQRLHDRNRYEGTGIGLSICKKIVERHGGRIWLESQPGAGTTFRLALPKRQAVLAFVPPED
ncbi:MAG: ATP-binding protein [Pseudomonadota bacterium]